ncbi:hypothetical protein ACF3MZ_21225 [Paenibacillaceae bacterium WGS1546]|uniref:hypothetical protein n=1 Tax=Cohnella sp. WGS1546 TaxID=3366810 RepID=UPI00372D8353
MRVKIEYGSYNSRRYGKPWGAKVSFEGAKLSYDFAAGSFLGDDRGGNVYIDCEPGDVVAAGQKDNRNPRYTENKLYIVQKDGSLAEIDKVTALEHWEQRQKVETDNPLAGYSVEDLVAELQRRGVTVHVGT